MTWCSASFKHCCFLQLFKRLNKSRKSGHNRTTLFPEVHYKSEPSRLLPTQKLINLNPGLHAATYSGYLCTKSHQSEEDHHEYTGTRMPAGAVEYACHSRTLAKQNYLSERAEKTLHDSASELSMVTVTSLLIMGYMHKLNMLKAVCLTFLWPF